MCDAKRSIALRLDPAAMLDSPQLKSVKYALRALQRRGRRAAVKWFFSYDSNALLDLLRRGGIRHGDAVMLHSAFEPHHGFRGTVKDVIDAFITAVGPEGHVLMPSLPYHTSSLEYLSKLQRFDTRKTPSAMGLISEFFRRRPGVLRSAHPTHPILVHGPRASWFIEGHERALYPCGPGTPFEKLLEADGKVAFFNVPFAYFTFFHFLEHHVSAHLNFPLYHEPAFEVPVVNMQGETVAVKTYAFGKEALKRRRFEMLEEWVRNKGLIRTVRVGASKLLTVSPRDVMSEVDEMTKRGVFFYDMAQQSHEIGRAQ